MINVVVIGSGNVATHFVKALQASPEVNLLMVAVRDTGKLAAIIPSVSITTNYNDLPEADVYIIAVSDDAIADVTAALPFTGQLVVHTSGSVDLKDADSKNRRGVLYPLQTLSSAKEVNFKEVPLCIEAESDFDAALLERLGQELSDNVYKISSAQRRALHVAAVFTSNFVNLMYHIGSDICAEHGMPFELLKPLIRETAEKVQYLHPANAQTGPALRHDQKTINRHIGMLTDPDQAEIYKLLTKTIQQLHEQKL